MKLPHFFKIFFSVFLVFILQLTVLKIKGVKLDIILIFIVYSGLKAGIGRSLATGFIFGLIEDVMSITSLGINTISKTLIGFFAGSIEILYKDNKFAQMFMVFIFTLLDSILVLMLTHIFKNSLTLHGFIVNSLPIAVFYNSFFTPICFYLFSKFVPSGKNFSSFDSMRKTGFRVSSDWI